MPGAQPVVGAVVSEDDGDFATRFEVLVLCVPGGQWDGELEEGCAVGLQARGLNDMIDGIASMRGLDCPFAEWGPNNVSIRLSLRGARRDRNPHPQSGCEQETRAWIERLAQIEKGHFLFVSSLVDYYDRPTEWVESAEFGLREEY